ncbi:phospholipid-transporting ATPase ABCA3-like [Glandiceps talaboti]
MSQYFFSVNYEPTNFSTDGGGGIPFPLPPGLIPPTALPPIVSSLPVQDIYCNLTKRCGELAWYPQTELTTDIMRRVSVNMQLLLTESEFDSEEDMAKVASEDTDKYFAAVVFDFPANETSLPLFTPYRIRVSTELVAFNSWNTAQTYSYYILTVPIPYNAYDERFLELQHAVDSTLIAMQSEQHTGSDDIFNRIRREVQRYPYPEWKVETFISTMQFLMPIIMCLSLIYSAGVITKELVLEKETRLKESMKMMGLSNWLHWSAWFVKCFMFLMISGFLMSIFLKVGEVFRYSAYGCILILLILWITAGIMWCFAVSVLFSKAKIAMVFAIILWYLNYVCTEFLLIDYFRVSASEKLAACLLHNTCLGMAIQTISRLESAHIGMTWSTLTVSPAYGYDVPIALIWVMFCVDIILYGLIAWYIEAVFPGEFGIPKPIYFPFMKSYWCGPNAIDNTVCPVNDNIEELEMSRSKADSHEPDPHDMKAGIRIKNLRKVYESSVGSKVAVDNLSMNMYENQITSLLGHNGAGKTTTMSILTGLFPPTAGTALVGGYDILTDMDNIRQSLGLCPQHNILFDRLTVNEHLEFFLGLKGIVGEEAKKASETMIEDLNLVDKANSKSSDLSGGMKRKLSVGIALIGQPRIVLLDEPTSGMDPYARRATWDLLLKHKPGKTVILTTHMMDEADLLGDRIAIMASGHLVCSGSSLFLKNRYGIGYHLTLVKQPQCNTSEIDNRIHSYVPKAELTNESGAELSYILPRESSAYFTTMCRELEDKRADLGIDSFGISVTTLEEVFLKVDQTAEDDEEEAKLKTSDVGHDEIVDAAMITKGDIPEMKNGEPAEFYEKDSIAKVSTESLQDSANANGYGSTDNVLNPNDTGIDMEYQDAYEQEGVLGGIGLKWQQFRAIFTKRLLHSKRDKKSIGTQLVLPLTFVLVGLLLLVVSPYFSEDEPRILTMHNLSAENPDAVTFFADLRIGDDERDILKYLPEALDNQGIQVINVTSEVFKIESDNAGNLKDGNEFTDPNDCCTYDYQILNEQCANEIHNSANEDLNICSDNQDFSYYHCPYCVLNTGYLGDFNDSCPVGVNTKILNYMNTYFEEYILRNSSIGAYFDDHVAGFTMTEDVDTNNSTLITVWYSNQPIHASAESLAVVDNALLQFATNSSYNLMVTNDPLPLSAAGQVSSSTEQSLILAICVVFGLGFLAASFAPFLISEKDTKAKLLQFVSGLDPLSYWFGTLSWDCINYIAVLVILVIVFAAFPTVYGPPNLGVTTLLLVLFGWASIPMTYAMSWPFSSPLAGYGLIAIFYSMGAMVTIIVVFILELLDHTQDAAVICDYIFMLIPTHCLGRAMIFMAQNVATIDQCTRSVIDQQLCESSGIAYEENLLAWNLPGVGQHCLYLFLEGVFWMTLTILMEVNFFIPARSPKHLGTFIPAENEDEDVKKERQKVNSITDPASTDAAVVLTNLTKVYSSTLDNIRRKVKDPSVNHLCLSIPKGECFGLLGINGAGKTTTFRMMTGDLGLTAGTAHMGGYSIQSEKREVQQRIGYCPQFDALIDKLTGREVLRMYARLRGIQPHMVEAVVNSCISHLNLGKWADKLCGDYSGGNKRKLSTATAMVGNPPMIFLDEPTAGMDPRARRFLWNAITRLMKGGRCIVLTSHSMEECEALCTRLAIMVNGQFKCLGSTQHLKSKFGSGYTLMVKVEQTVGTQPIKDFVTQAFPVSKLLEEHMGMLHYQIDDNTLTWSYIFGQIEGNKEQLQLIDYSVSQTSLDQVFVNFAKGQHSEDKKS